MQNYEEYEIVKVSGWFSLMLWLLLGGGLLWNTISIFPNIMLSSAVIRGVVFLFFNWLFLSGLKIVQPNEAKVFTLFGNYAGSLKEDGFWYVNPLASSYNVSLKVYNYATDILKVNDLKGTPVEIGCVITYSIENTAKAAFSVDNVDIYVKQQCEAALRNLSAHYPYDGEGMTLRGQPDAIAIELKKLVAAVVSEAGVVIHNARLSHLAYAPEIAQSMLRVQQAKAVLEARKTIVEGAVGMVEDTISSFQQNSRVKLDEQHIQELTVNLMTVLVSDKDTQPVISLKD